MVPSGNLVIDGFSPALKQKILAAARPREIPLRTVLVSQGRLPANIVFLTSGLASLVVTMEDGASSEAGMRGRESMTGVSTFLGTDLNHADCIMQIPGKGLCVPRHTMVDLFETCDECRHSVLQIAQSEMNISARLSACNLRHEAQARFARWLLTASDRIGSETLLMSQECFAAMLGTQRTTVSLVGGSLQRLGLIRQSRGMIVLLDRPGLLAAACECYGICRRSMYPLLGNLSPAIQLTPSFELSHPSFHREFEISHE
jgi:CRP-like cAMP-binding protein